MSDERLRELARQAAEGNEEARVRLVVERIRAGDTDSYRLAIAAWLVGDGGSLDEFLDRFEETLQDIARRPALYVGTSSYSDVAHYLEGMYGGLQAVGLGTILPLSTWRLWVQYRYVVSHAGWGWPRIIRHHHKSDEEAIQSLPSLFAEFRRDLRELGEDKISERWRERLIDRYGRDWGCPTDAGATS